MYSKTFFKNYRSIFQQRGIRRLKWEIAFFFFLLSIIMNYIKANYLYDNPACLIKNSEVKRTWMDQSSNRFAYRCLPLSIANQTSWDVICPSSIKAIWQGDKSVNGVDVQYLDDHQFKYASSIFGEGVLTFHVDFVITSSENTSLLVKGPANHFKKHLSPLEAIVETHWLPFTFTYNWIFNEPGEVVFEKGEPMFSFFPINLDYVESFSTEVDYIVNDPEFKEAYNSYCNSRSNFISSTRSGDDWQKYYMQGISPANPTPNKNHKSRVILNKFNYEK
jgi:Family of unknown function (DUF6065)